MNHYLITRFNLKKTNWNPRWKINQQLALSDEWLKYRFELFEKYCFPSVYNQSNQNFTWCVFFDIKTPDYYKERVAR